MNRKGGYILLDISDLDFTSSSKQTTKKYTDRLAKIEELGKPVLVVGVPNHQPMFGNIVKTSTYYTLTYLDSTNVIDIKFETTGTTITTTSVKNPTN